MQVRLKWSAHKHELLPDEVSTVIQMSPNQSACDGITDLAESGPRCLMRLRGTTLHSRVSLGFER